MWKQNLRVAPRAALSAPLYRVLELQRKPDAFPWAALPKVRIIDLIYYKYTPALYKQKGDSAKAIERVVTAGQPVATLDLPTILYSTRDWLLHGALVDSSFRGSPRDFQDFAAAATKALAWVLKGAMSALLPRL